MSRKSSVEPVSKKQKSAKQPQDKRRGRKSRNMNDNSVGIEKMRERVRKQIEHDEPVLMSDDASDAVDPDLMTKEVFGVVKAQNTVMVGIQWEDIHIVIVHCVLTMMCMLPHSLLCH